MGAPVQLLGLCNGKLVPVAVDSDGNLQVGATIEAQIGAVEIANDEGNPVPVSLAGGATAAKQDTLAALVATAAKQDTLAALVATAAKQDTLYNALVGVPAVRLSYKTVGVEITRPTEGSVTAYAANDVFADSASAPTIITFANAGRIAGGSGNIIKGRAFTNSATALLGAQIRLHLYHTAPAAINDNAPFTLLYANKSKRIGFIDFPVLASEAGSSDSSGSLWVDLPLAFTCAAGDTNLYAIAALKTAGAAQLSAQKLYIELDFEQH